MDSADQLIDALVRTWGPAGGALAVLMVATRLIWRFQESITEAAISDAGAARVEAQAARVEAANAREQRDEALAELARARRLLLIHGIETGPGPTVGQ